MSAQQRAQDRRELRNEVFHELINQQYFITMFPPSEELFIYDNNPESATYGTWQSDLAEKIIFEYVERRMGEICTRYDKNEVITRIKHNSFHNLSKDSEFWSSTPENYICVKNGVLNIETGELKDHNRKYRFLAKIPVEYIPPENPRLKDKDRIERFINSILNHDKDRKSVYELAGYCLYRSSFLHNWFLFEGDGSNGKSTLITLLENFLGKENVSHITPQSLIKNRFSIINLRGKFGNFYNDITAKALEETGIIKMVVAGDTMSGEKKFLQGRLDFDNYAKLVFSCNQVPPVIKDDTTAWWRRIILFTFENVFSEENENINKKILGELIDPLELSSFLNGALEGLRRLLKDEQFTNKENIEKTREKYIAKSDPIWAFAETKLEMKAEAFEVKRIVYEAYKQFCREHNFSPKVSYVFSRRLRNFITYEDVQKTIGEKSHVHCYGGIRLIGGEPKVPIPEPCPKCKKPLLEGHKCKPQQKPLVDYPKVELEKPKREEPKKPDRKESERVEEPMDRSVCDDCPRTACKRTDEDIRACLQLPKKGVEETKVDFPIVSKKKESVDEVKQPTLNSGSEKESDYPKGVTNDRDKRIYKMLKEGMEPEEET